MNGFGRDKENTLASLDGAIRAGKVDSGVIPLLDAINSLDDYYTTSSCAGRTQLLEVESIGRKDRSRWLGKWHSPPEIGEVAEAMEGYREGLLLLQVQSPIIHIACRDLDAAVAMRNTAVNSGLKYSSIRSVTPARVIVEVLDSGRLDVPLGRDGVLVAPLSVVAMTLDIGRKIMEKASKRLERFRDAVASIQ